MQMKLPKGMVLTTAHREPLKSASVLPQLPLVFESLVTLDAVESIAPEWEELLRTSGCNWAFSSPAWFKAAAKQKEGAMPFVLLARRAGRLVALLPLVTVNHGEQAELLVFSSDYGDIIGAHGDTEAICEVFRYALAPLHGYRRLQLQRLRMDSNCLKAAQLCLSEAELHEVSEPDPQRYSYVEIRPDYELYLQSRTRNFRKNLLRARRYAEGRVTVKEIFPAAMPPDLLPETFLCVHLSRFRGASPFERSSMQVFLQDLLPALFASGILRVFVVMQASRIIAMDLCIRGANSLCTWSSGFLPEAREFSPGNLLMDAEARQAHVEGLLEYDLMRGAEEYKSSWATHAREVISLNLSVRS